MRIIRIIFFLIFILSLPTFLIATTLSSTVNEIKLYEYNIDKYDISKISGIDVEELQRVFQHLIYFYNSKVDSAQIEISRGGNTFAIFNETEILHLEDIKGLMRLDYRVQLISLALLIISGSMLVMLSKERWRSLCKALFWGSISTLCIILFLAIWTALDFQRLFILFHVVSFANEFWMLNPNTDYLKMIFPDAFFFDAVVFILSALIIESLFIAGIAFSINRYKQ